VGIKELGLRLAAVGSLSILPTAAIAIEIGVTGTGHGNACSGYGDQRSFPLFITKRGLPFKDDLAIV
jgi:hypothetical protein